MLDHRVKECSGPDEVEALQREIEQVGEFDEELETVIERLREQAPLDFGDSEDEGVEQDDSVGESGSAFQPESGSSRRPLRRFQSAPASSTSSVNNRSSVSSSKNNNSSSSVNSSARGQDVSAADAQALWGESRASLGTIEEVD